MDKDLMKKGAALGLNVSLYFLLPPKERDEALRQDILREIARRKEMIKLK